MSMLTCFRKPGDDVSQAVYVKSEHIISVEAIPAHGVVVGSTRYSASDEYANNYALITLSTGRQLWWPMQPQDPPRPDTPVGHLLGWLALERRAARDKAFT